MSAVLLFLKLLLAALFPIAIFRFSPARCCAGGGGPCTAVCSNDGPDNWSLTFTGITAGFCGTDCLDGNDTIIVPFHSSTDGGNTCISGTLEGACRWGQVTLIFSGNFNCLGGCNVYLLKCSNGDRIMYVKVTAPLYSATFRKVWTDDTPCNGLTAVDIPLISSSGSCNFSAATCAATSA